MSTPQSLTTVHAPPSPTPTFLQEKRRWPFPVQIHHVLSGTRCSCSLSLPPVIGGLPIPQGGGKRGGSRSAVSDLVASLGHTHPHDS